MPAHSSTSSLRQRVGPIPDAGYEVDPLLAPSGQVHREEAVESPGRLGGGLGPSTGADVLAGALLPMQQLPLFDPLEGVGVPGVCWVCQRPYDFSVSDFDTDGRHAVCSAKARRMEAGFAAQRDTRTLTNRAQVNWLDQRAVQW